MCMTEALPLPGELKPVTLLYQRTDEQLSESAVAVAPLVPQIPMNFNLNLNASIQTASPPAPKHTPSHTGEKFWVLHFV